MIANAFSVVSAGTEKMVMDLAKKSLLAKARARPDQVRRVLEKVRTEGVVETMRSSILRVLKRRLESVPAFVREKLDAIQSPELLEEVLDQAAVARSIDELVLEP